MKNKVAKLAFLVLVFCGFGLSIANAQSIEDPFPKEKACRIIVTSPGEGAVLCTGEGKLCWGSNDCSWIIE